MKEIYKGLEIRSEPGGTLKSIRHVGKGSVPKELRGLYTSSLDAMRSIDSIVREEVVEDGETTK